MKFTGTLRHHASTWTKYRTALDTQPARGDRPGALEWLEATVIAEVPVWSGASRATFLALARNIEYNIPIFPVAPSRVGQGVSQSSGTLEAECQDGPLHLQLPDNAAVADR